MSLWYRFHFLKNLRIHWGVRMCIDTMILSSPVVLYCCYPYTFYHFFEENNRKMRRREYTGVDLLEDNTLTAQQAMDFYTEHGFEDIE